MQLPVELRDTIDTLIGGDNRKTLSDAANAVSLKYRRENNHDLQIASELEAKAYIATRLPATWCAVTEVLQKFLQVSPDFSPATSLDLGAGPGTASLAVQNIWPDIKPDLLEPNSHLRKLGRELLPGNWQDKKLQSASFDTAYDLVISSYVLNEIEGDLDATLEKIWAATNQAFVLIEPGTPQGYETILKARDFFLKRDVILAAPCPHSFECPLRNTERWCHFSVRVDRSRTHLQLKTDAVLSYEDEKFSYLIATRTPVPLPAFRVLGHPHGQKVVRLETCNADGTFKIQEFSKKSPHYKAARKIEWGDALFNRD